MFPSKATIGNNITRKKFSGWMMFERLTCWTHLSTHVTYRVSIQYFIASNRISQNKVQDSLSQTTTAFQKARAASFKIPKCMRGKAAETEMKLKLLDQMLHLQTPIQCVLLWTVFRCFRFLNFGHHSQHLLTTHTQCFILAISNMIDQVQKIRICQMLHSFLFLFIFKMYFYMYDMLNWIVHTSLKPKLPSTIPAGFFPPRKKFGLMRGGKVLCSANGSRCIWISFCRWVHVCLRQQCSAHLASGSNIISANALCTGGQKWILCK